MEPKKVLVFTTIAATLLLFGGATLHYFHRQRNPVELNTKGFLSIGKAQAPVEIVLIEDFRCRNCREFSEKILPKIQAEFIQKGIARFTLVPISFLSGSQPIANAALAVYKTRPDRFFPYLQQIFSQSGERELTVADLLRAARRVGGIDLASIETAIEQGSYDIELEKNLAWAHQLMGASFKTPALFVNGVPVSTLSFMAIQERIKTILQKKS